MEGSSAMGKRWRLAVLAGLFTLVTACGGGEGDTNGVASIDEPDTTSSSGAPEDGEPDIDQMRAFAKCMREHGIDVKDPDASGGGVGIAVPAEGPDGKEKIDKANEACKQHLPNGGEPRKPTAEELDQAREMAKCLREHGIEVKEPTADDPGISIGSGDGTDNDPEKVNKAMEECAPEGTVTGDRAEPAK
jgi:hypothetical protein